MQIACRIFFTHSTFNYYLKYPKKKKKKIFFICLSYAYTIAISREYYYFIAYFIFSLSNSNVGNLIKVEFSLTLIR